MLDYALKQIALAVGFKTIHHFTRRFAIVEGTPPSGLAPHVLAGNSEGSPDRPQIPER